MESTKAMATKKVTEMDDNDLKEAHYKLWNWLHDNPGCSKRDYFKSIPEADRDSYIPTNGCYACSFADKKYLESNQHLAREDIVENGDWKTDENICEFCPCTWIGVGHNIRRFMCEDNNSPFTKWRFPCNRKNPEKYALAVRDSWK